MAQTLKRFANRLTRRASAGVLLCLGSTACLAEYPMIAGCGDPSCEFRAELRTEPQVPTSGEATTLEITLRDGSGALVSELQIHHARKLHVVIIGEDLQVLGHVHPQDFDAPVHGGRGRVRFAFPRPGRYLVAADVMTGTGPHAATFFVQVADSDPERAAALAPVEPGLRVVELLPNDRYVEPVLLDAGHRTNGYEVEMRIAERADAGRPTSLVYHFSRDGAPIRDLRPYLDAPMHLAVVKEDFSRFLHRHGTLPGSQAEDPHAGHRAHHGQESGSSSRFGPDVNASVDFPEPGRYFLFGQAARGDELLVFRTSVVVE